MSSRNSTVPQMKLEVPLTTLPIGLTIVNLRIRTHDCASSALAQCVGEKDRYDLKEGGWVSLNSVQLVSIALIPRMKKLLMAHTILCKERRLAGLFIYNIIVIIRTTG